MDSMLMSPQPANFPFFLSLSVQAIPENPAELLSRVSVGKALLAIAALVLTYLIVRLSNKVLLSLGNRNVRARLLFSSIPPVLGFLLWTAGTYAALAILAPSQNALLALVASIGLAIGLGAQDLIKSLIGGIVILADRPFQLGDRVKIGDAYGEIDHIGLRSVKLTTPDDTRVTIPNSEVLSSMAWNANSGMPDCQVVTEMFLPCDTAPETALEIGYEAAFSSPYILLSKPVVVLLQDRYTESPFLQIRVKAYVYDHRMEGRFQTDILARAKAEFLRRGLLAPWSGAARANS